MTLSVYPKLRITSRSPFLFRSCAAKSSLQRLYLEFVMSLFANPRQIQGSQGNSGDGVVVWTSKTLLFGTCSCTAPVNGGKVASLWHTAGRA